MPGTIVNQVDDADSIGRFIAAMNFQHSGTLPSQPLSDVGSQLSTLDVTLNESTLTQTDGATQDHTAIAETPINNRSRANSRFADAQPTRSPHIAGLLAPHNTPQTMPSSPRPSPYRNGLCDDEDFGDGVFEVVRDIQGKPLSESIWAPQNTHRQRTQVNGRHTDSRDLTPIRAVQPNPAINQDFTRMSFKAADPDHKTGDNIVGEHVGRLFSTGLPPHLRGKEQEANTDLPPHLRRREQALLPNTTSVIEQSKGCAAENIAGPSSSANAAEKKPESSESHVLPSQFPVHEGPADKQSSAPLSPDKSSSEAQAPSTAQLKREVSMGSTASAVATPTIPEISKSAAAESGNQSSSSPGTVALSNPKASKEPENRENALFFQSWPKSEGRDKPAAQIRKVILKNLPSSATPTFVSSVVFGGPLEEIYMRMGDSSAAVKFLHATDCQKFYDETSNGLVYAKNAQGHEQVIWVELAKDVDVVGGLLSGWIGGGVTRCVRVVPVEEDVGEPYLMKIASRKNRKVEGISDGKNAGGSRTIIFRFCNIADAVTFKAALSREEEWEHCGLTYSDDPCAKATGVHL